MAIFKVHQGDDEWNFNLRKSFMSVVPKYHGVDKTLRNKHKKMPSGKEFIL